MKTDSSERSEASDRPAGAHADGDGSTPLSTNRPAGTARTSDDAVPRAAMPKAGISYDMMRARLRRLVAAR